MFKKFTKKQFVMLQNHKKEVESLLYAHLQTTKELLKDAVNKLPTRPAQDRPSNIELPEFPIKKRRGFEQFLQSLDDTNVYNAVVSIEAMGYSNFRVLE